MKKILRTIIISLSAFGAITTQAADKYVKPGGTGDGSTWANAAGDIQTAVTAAVAGETVFVSNGTYTLSAQITVSKGITVKSFNNGVVDRAGTIINGNNYVGRTVTNRCFTLSHANAVLEGFTITNGYTATVGGGGVYMSAGTLRNCLIIGNSTYGVNGGGVFATSAGCMVTNCSIIGNTAGGPSNLGGSGGGLYMETGGQIWNSLIAENKVPIYAGYGGGARLNSATMVNCQVISNTCLDGYMTGGVYCHGTVVMRNCLIMGNGRGRASTSAGLGSHAYGGLNAYVENCTIVDNRGAGISTQFGGGNYYLKNTVAYRNDDDTLTTVPTANNSVMVISNSCVSSTNGMTSGSGNTTAEPSFVRRSAGDYRLTPWSVGVDTGLVLPWMSTATDLDENPRISVNNLPDMGAYETTAGSVATHYVARTGQTPVPPYTAGWTAAASNIQDVVNIMSDGATILVKSGATYPFEDQIVTGFATIRSDNNGTLDRDTTIISANNYPGKSVTNRCFHINDAEAIVEGFTITNGLSRADGGGVYLSAGTLRNCLVAGNISTNLSHGGGIYATGSRSLITNCDIVGNAAYGTGGGVQVTTSAKLQNSRVRGNRGMTATTTGSFGGGVWMGASAVLQNCEIVSNIAPSSAVGGGVCIAANGLTIRNCLIAGNSSPSGGGGVGIWGALTGETVENCTLFGNMPAGGASSGIGGTWHAKTLTIRNTICQDSITVAGTILVTNSCLLSTNIANATFSATITNNPVFVNAAGLDFRLKKGSPCIDTGLNQSWMDGALDLDGLVRKDRFASIVDMGAYEFVPLPRGTVVLVR